MSFEGGNLNAQPNEKAPSKLIHGDIFNYYGEELEVDKVLANVAGTDEITVMLMDGTTRVLPEGEDVQLIEKK